MAIGLLICLMTTASPALADQSEMLRLSAEGDSLFEAQKYEEAAELYERAYAAHPNDNSLKNVAVSYFQAKLCPEAASAARKYQATSTTKDERDLADLRTIQVRCGLKIAAQKIEAKEWAAAEIALSQAAELVERDKDKARAEELARELKKGRAAEGSDDDEDAEVVEEDPPPQPEAPSSALTWAGWGAAAVGAGLVGFQVYQSAVVGPALNDDIDSISAGCPDICDLVEWQRLEGDVDAIRDGQPLFYGVGGALILIGVGLIVWDASSEPAQLVVGPTSARAVWHF